MKQLRAVVSWTNVAFAAEWAHCDGVFVQGGQVVAEAAVHVSDTVEFWRDETGEKGDKSGGEESLQKVLSTVELGYDYVFAVVDPCEGYVKFAVYSNVGVFGKYLERNAVKIGLFHKNESKRLNRDKVLS